MSQFLAPIHAWLFNKISILENIEKDIANSLETKELKDKHEALLKEFGGFIPDEPLENLIDQSNIHGWLQERITVAERRQASLVNELMEVSSDAVEGISNIYETAGYTNALSHGLKVDEPSEIYKLLGDALLEGMPCDRVNRVAEQNQEKISWLTVTCVHKLNWEQAGVAIENYYSFREAFTRGFVRGLNEEMTYTYTLTDQQQQFHQITK